jgi:hypothetical protein
MNQPSPEPPSSPAPDAEQWEYYSTPVGTKVLYEPQTRAWLREAGVKGWELVAITPLSLPGANRVAGVTSEVLYTFKRRLRPGGP